MRIRMPGATRRQARPRAIVGWIPLVALMTVSVAIRADAAVPGFTVTARGEADVVPKVPFYSPGDTLSLNLDSNFVTVLRSDGTLALTWRSPLWKATTSTAYGGSKTYDVKLYGPAIILGTNAFRIRLQNNLPFQAPCSCGCNVTGDDTYCDNCKFGSIANLNDNPLGVFNGVHNLMVTNIHTHGLKVDPGANDIFNLDPCSKLYNASKLCFPEGSAIPPTVKCNIYGDNIFPNVQPGGMTATNTYFLPPTVPGTAWYHDHAHGSVAYLTPSTNGALLIPDMRPDELFAPFKVPYYKDYTGVGDWRDWDYAISKDQYADPWKQHQTWKPATGYPKAKEWDDFNMKEWAKYTDRGSINDCKQFIDLMARNPNYADHTPIIVFSGLWFRKNANLKPSDDTHPWIACNALPPSPLLCPKGLTPDGDTYNLENIDNPAGQDWVIVNNKLQPELKLEAGRFKRWLLLSTFTMKWMDLTIHEFNPDAPANFTRPTTSCKMWLLSHDGVYLERIPRFPQSANKTDPNTKGAWVNNVMLGPGNRADIFIKCDKPGKYALVSCGGPYNTNAACVATHCECFGGSINLPDQVTPGYGNNIYGSTTLNAAVLATIHVAPSYGYPEPDLKPEVCRTRLELFPYTNVNSFPNQVGTFQNQCYNLVNMGNGSACNVNGVLFGNFTLPPTRNTQPGLACLNEGYTQNWLYRGIDFHPFHLHETPVRSEKLPDCLNNNETRTNFWKVGDWWDTVFIPNCQCNTTDCETMNTKFIATLFPTAPKQADFATPNPKQLAYVANAFIKNITKLNTLGINPNLVTSCDDRFSVLHCHHLSHEDEGCMAAVWWNCIPNPEPQSCVDNNGICPAMTDAQRLALKKLTHKMIHDNIAKGIAMP